MFDLDDILKNDTVKGLLDKAGVDEKQAKSVGDQAVKAIEKQFKNNPKQTASLLSENENTDDDNRLASAIESDFVTDMIEKLGVSEGTAKQIQGVMPGVIDQARKQLTKSGKNNEGGIAGTLGGIMDMF